MKIKTSLNLITKNKYLAIVIPILMSAQAQSIEFNMGEIEGSFDSQLSIGSSWRVESQDPSLISGVTDKPSNSDDANRNYKGGDAFSQIFKGSHDLQFSYQNVGGFIRGKYWYDSALDNNSVAYGHSPTTTGSGVGGAELPYDNPNTKLDDSSFNDLSKAKGATLLDAFIYGEFEILDMPVDLRLGKQVVSWGESTFIRGGVNSINPVDVNAFRRPGAEIKEGLLPVNMVYSNIGLTQNLSMETFYQLEFQETVVPGCGTFFSTNDYAAEGCNSISVLGGATSIARADEGVHKASDEGQFGIAFRYLSEALGDTEFGFYAMNIHSRAPLISGIKHSLSGAQEGAAYVTGANLAYGTANLSTTQGETPAALQVGIDAGDQNSIALQAAATSAGNSYVAVARATGSRYFSTFPEDIQLAGLSFATNVGPIALSGELSHTLDMPIQINGPSLISTLLTGQSIATELEEEYAATPAGGTTEGFRRFDVTQAQLSAIKFIDQFAGASRMTLIGEAGYTFIHSFSEDVHAIKFGRADSFGIPGSAESEDDGFVTERSWGYRARLVAEYSDSFFGMNLKPTIAWSHDVKGYAPQPGGNFSEGQKSLGLSVQATYLETYSANVSYTQYMGGDFSVLSDHDFASISLGMQF